MTEPQDLALYRASALSDQASALSELVRAGKWNQASELILDTRHTMNILAGYLAGLIEVKPSRQQATAPGRKRPYKALKV